MTFNHSRLVQPKRRSAMRVVTVNCFKWPYRGRGRPVTYGERPASRCGWPAFQNAGQAASCGVPHYDEPVGLEKSPASRHAGQLFTVASVIGQH